MFSIVVMNTYWLCIRLKSPTTRVTRHARDNNELIVHKTQTIVNIYKGCYTNSETFGVGIVKKCLLIKSSRERTRSREGKNI